MSGLIGKSHIIAGLPNIEFRRIRSESAVEDSGIVVQVANEFLRRIRDPNTTVINVDFSGRNALVKNGKSRNSDSESRNQRSRDPASVHALSLNTILLLHLLLTTLAQDRGVDS